MCVCPYTSALGSECTLQDTCASIPAFVRIQLWSISISGASGKGKNKNKSYFRNKNPNYLTKIKQAWMCSKHSFKKPKKSTMTRALSLQDSLIVWRAAKGWNISALRIWKKEEEKSEEKGGGERRISDYLFLPPRRPFEKKGLRGGIWGMISFLLSS